MARDHALTPTPGVPRHLTIPSLAELLEHYSYLPAREARVWANKDREALMKRPPIPASLRREVYDRDGHACVECGATERLSLDHIIPWSLCGPDELDNLQTLCISCNSRKGVKV